MFPLGGHIANISHSKRQFFTSHPQNMSDTTTFRIDFFIIFQNSEKKVEIHVIFLIYTYTWQ